MIKIEYKKILFINLIFLIFILFFQQRVDAVVNITTESNGEYTTKSDLFDLVDSSGNNISTNSHYKFLNFWYDENGKFVILWKGDKQAYSNHKPSSIVIAGVSINQMYEYSSIEIKDSAGNVLKQYNAQNGAYHYFTVYLDSNEKFINGFNINFNTGAGGFDIDTTAKVNFYVLVQHNISGTVTTDWEQSIGNKSHIGEERIINCRKYSRTEYEDVDITFPNGTTKKEITESIEVTVQNGVTKVIFNYDSSQTIDINVSKIWNDDYNSQNTRPSNILIYITIDEEETSTYYKLDCENESSYIFSNLPKYDSSENLINYGVMEKEFELGDLRQYKKIITGDTKNGFIIENILLKDYINTIDILLSGPEKIIAYDDVVTYNINFSFSVNGDYQGNIVKFYIEDLLEYPIDETKDNFFDKGEYNKVTNSIIWSGVYDISNNTITWSNGETEILSPAPNIQITKEIRVVYKNLIENNDKTILNKVIGKTELIEALPRETTDNVSTLIEIDSKSFVPELVKTFEDNSKYNNVAIGDTVNFKLISYVPKMDGYDTYNYSITDNLTDKFSYDNNMKITIDNIELTKDIDYVLKEENSTLKIEFLNFIDQKDKVGKEIKIVYTANLKDNAIIGNNGNETNALLEYSNNPNDSLEKGITQPTCTYTYTTNLNLIKIDSKHSSKLSEAEFTIQNEENIIDTLKTNEEGIDSSIGLSAGLYTITEIKAPDGYNKLEEPIQIRIVYIEPTGTDNKCNWEATFEKNVNNSTIQVIDGKISLTIPNTSGIILPTTGSIGTTIFYVLGIAFILGSALLLFNSSKNKRKRHNY